MDRQKAINLLTRYKRQCGYRDVTEAINLALEDMAWQRIAEKRELSTVKLIEDNKGA